MSDNADEPILGDINCPANNAEATDEISNKSDAENEHQDPAPSKSIQVIDKKTVHRICSGQVVLDLATAVKELVENSIDSGASNVEIKLKEHGKESIEVSDNGSGIKECDFESIALKHYTSKLREFDDLPSVNTFGFRGEALSSLSALGEVSITTHHGDADVASKLIFDHDGKLVTRNHTAREQGTTVCVANLFSTLPVRFKEFHRNYKRDFTKLINILYAFCLVNRHVRISCFNQVGSRKNKLISTNGKDSIIDTISNIFGVNQIKDILKIEQKLPTETILNEFNMTTDFYEKYSTMFKMNGYISSVRHGCGRSTTDRQFYFINKRPCDFPKLSRLVNEVYHGFNLHQYPFVYLEMELNKDFVDVNVTPDKRQIMIQQENILLVIVKSTLKHMFEENATYYAENITISTFGLSPVTTPNTSTPSPLVKSAITSCGTGLSPLDRFRSKYEKVSGGGSIVSQLVKKQKLVEQQNLLSFFSIENKKRKDNDFEESAAKKFSVPYADDDDDEDHSCVDQEGRRNAESLHVEMVESNVINSNKEEPTNDNPAVDPSVESAGEEGNQDYDIPSSPKSDVIVCDVAKDIALRPKVNAKFDMQKIRKKFESYIARKPLQRDLNENGAFCAKISANENVSAEEELGRNITKQMFAKMQIIGQFNLGFIIAKLKNDLFIVDQHASDEKYNYETLQRTHCLKGQRLIQPLHMELNLVNKSILMDNLEIFKKNGFEFEIKEICTEESDGTQCHDVKVSLLTIPTSKNWTFSVEDVEELIYLLSDSPGIMCRPSRVHKMYASRACRKSIMVGTALNHQKMKQLMSHMGEINHPWNCPHGRPTMRHLINLKRVSGVHCT